MASTARRRRYWSVDLNAGVSYLTLTDKPIVRTVQAGPVNVDLDAQGEAVGVEFLYGGAEVVTSSSSTVKRQAQP